MNDLRGLSIQPDGWAFNFGKLEGSDGFKDSSFPGCAYRLPSDNYKLAVNVTLTGRKSHDVGSYNDPWFKTRVKIEYVGDGSPSVFDGGWVFSPTPLVGI